MEGEMTPNSQSILSKKEQYWRDTILDFKLYYRAIVTQTACYWQKYRQIHDGIK
jgi:hypothetical protein